MKQLLPKIISKTEVHSVAYGVYLDKWTLEDIEATYGKPLAYIVEFYKMYRPKFVITDFRYPAASETVVAKGVSMDFKPYYVGRTEAECWRHVEQPIIYVDGHKGPRLILKRLTAE